ncbi:hypothetical protein D3C77_322260 [compost metagenome]
MLMTIWVVSARAGSLVQFDKAFESIEEVLKVNYCGVLEVAEIENALSSVRSSNREYLRERSKHYLCLWLCIVLVLVVGFIGGNWYFPTVPAGDSSNSKLVTPSSEVKGVGGERPILPEAIRVDPKPSVSPGNSLDRRVDLRQEKVEEFCCR